MSRVLWVTSSYPWVGDPVGGIFFGTQARMLVRLGLEVTVVSPTPVAPWPLPLLRRRWRDYAAVPSTGTDEGVLILRPRYPNVPGQPSWSAPDRLIARAAARVRPSWSEARLIHGHYSLVGLAAWRLARRTGLPLVLTFHGDDLNRWPEDHPERLADLRSALRAAAAVTAVSAPLVERIRSLAGVEAIHLPLGCDHERLARAAIDRDVARQALGIPPDAVVVLFVGLLHRTKGLYELSEALQRAGRPFYGVFVGDGPERPGLARQAGPSVDLRGAQPNDEVVRFMCAADVLVLPSYREGLPTVLVEAGSLRLPVIASRVGGIPDLLAEDRGMLLTDITPDAIVASLRAFVADREAARARASRLRDHVLRYHSTAQSASRLLEIYRSIAPDLRPAPA